MSIFGGPFGTLSSRHYDRKRVCEIRGCGKPRWGWTNLMEPLCLDHFHQRRVIQNLLVMFSGRGNWASLVVAHNPDAFAPYTED